MATTRRRPVTRIGSTVLVAGAVVAAGSSCASSVQPSGADFCAIMSDSIGLYVDNPVTQMGYPIGKVTAISADPGHVRIDFAMTEKRPIPADVKALIRSPTILADRSLELAGNYSGGPQLAPGQCIPLERTVTPKSLSEVIGSADTFVKAISPEGSTNVADSVRGLNQLMQNNGARAGQLITQTSALLDSPDQAVSDMGSIMANLSDLTTSLKEMRGPIKEILQDSVTAVPDVATALDGTTRLAGPTGAGNLGPLIEAVAVLETRMGDETQLTLDTVGASVRKLSPHANAFADLLNPVPSWINTVANHYNGHQFSFFNIAYRPPMFRVQTHDGLALCGFMNATTPGSCADVNGQPYAVDIALLQYVLTQANHS
ncbi:MAG: MCE family protein [Mycobacterium sp.]|nr:MCE family protein [Mycobacterium sp.]